MDPDHYSLCEVGFCLVISISTCLCKEPAAAGEQKEK